MDKAIIFWVIFGVVLMLIELILPGLVVVFLGMAALLVALGLYMGLLNGWLQALTAWFVISIVLTLTLRSMCARLIPGIRRKGNINEDLDAFGTIVEVVAVNDPPSSARISFRGSTWDAEYLRGELAVGDQVRLLTRDNLIWVVEPVKD